MKTVGIVTITGGTVTEGKIDFGLTTSYGMTAPIDVAAASYRTLLLGMKQSKAYHYRVTAKVGGSDCVTPDATLMTGNLAAGLTKPTLSPATASVTGLFGGFLITGQYVQGAGAGATAYILDGDGEYVWSFGIGSDVTTARMSYDGKWMWIQSANVPSGTAHVHRVSMDGQMDQDLSSKFAGANHQLTVLPDETVAFYAYSSNGCEDIKEYSPAGAVKTIINAKTARGGSSACHVNNIQYSKEDDTLVFSDLDTSTITKVKRSTGATVWSLGGTSASATQTYQGTPWLGGEHGIHILGVDKLLFFRNNSGSVPGGAGSLGGDGSGSCLMEMMLNNSAKTYTVQADLQGVEPEDPERRHGRRAAPAERQLRDWLFDRGPAPGAELQRHRDADLEVGRRPDVRLHREARHPLRPGAAVTRIAGSGAPTPSRDPIWIAGGVATPRRLRILTRRSYPSDI